MFFSRSVRLQQDHFLKQAFNSRYAGIVCLLLAVLNKCIIALVYTDLEGDKSLYLLFAKNFLQTGLLAEPVNIIENGASVYAYNPAVHSPLYSLVAAPFLWLTASYFTTELIVSILGWIICFTGLYKVAHLLFKEKWITNLFILCAGFFLYPHELDAGPKDTLATAFTLWSIYFSYQFIGGKVSYKNTFFLSVSLSCMALIKLLYAPLVLVFLVLLFVFGKRQKTYVLHYGLLVGALLLTSVLFYLAVLQPLYYLPPVLNAVTNDGTTFAKGFYPQNLTHAFPFVSSSIINTNFWGVQIESRTELSFTCVMHIFQLADVAMVALLLFVLFYKRLHIRKLQWLMITVAVALSGLVIYLSVTEQAVSYKSSTNLWTFVSDARTFLFPMLVIQLLLFLFVFTTKRAKTFRILLLLLLVFECLHGLYFTIKATASFNEVRAAKNNGSPNKKLINRIIELQQKQEHINLVTSDNTLRRYALMNGILTYTFGNVEQDLSATEKNKHFIIATHLQDSAILKKFAARDLVVMDTLGPYVLHSYKAR
jgi:hypothetical protein